MWIEVKQSAVFFPFDIIVERSRSAAEKTKVICT